MQIIRKMASAGPRQLAMLRDAHCLESCIHLVKHAPLDSMAANLAVTLLREFAEWDLTSRCLSILQMTLLLSLASPFCRVKQFHRVDQRSLVA